MDNNHPLFNARQHPGPSLLGKWLAEGRTARGYSLDELAEALRIQRSYLAALEREDFSALPARPYVSGYVHSYAIRVGLDPREANRRLLDVLPLEEPDLPKVAVHRFSDVGREQKVRGSGFLGVAMIAAVAGYAFWYFDTVKEREPANLSPVAELETPPTSKSPPAPDTAEAHSPPETVVLGPLAPVGLEQLPTDYVADFLARAQPQPAEASKQPLPEGPFPRPRPETPAAEIWASIYKPPVPFDQKQSAEEGAERAGAERLANTDVLPSASHLAAYLPKLQLREDLGPLNGGVPAVRSMVRSEHSPQAAQLEEPLVHHRTQAYAAVPPSSSASDRDGPPQTIGGQGIVLKANGSPSWIEIREASGEIFVSRLLKPGETIAVPDHHGMLLTTGNASVLEIWVNGVRAPKLDGDDIVVRDIPLDAAALLRSP